MACVPRGRYVESQSNMIFVGPRGPFLSWVAGLSVLILFLSLIPSLGGLTGAAHGGEVIPLAFPAESTPWTIQYETQQFLIHEAHTKARLLAVGPSRNPSRNKNATSNMDLFDVHFYHLDLDLDPGNRILTGTVTVTARVVGADLTSLDLNLNDNLIVAWAKAGGQEVTASHVGDILTVTLDRTYVSGEPVSVQVAYSGDPAGPHFGWDTYDGQPLIWTLSEPYGARDWWPCKDLNTDKADSVDITVTVPEDLIVASNGLLAAETVPSPGKKTFAWRERYPIATYLVSLAIHPFIILLDEYVADGGVTMPIEHYVVADRAADAYSGFAITPDMITAFAGVLGEYPFLEEKYGHAHFPWGGGMEHQTLTSLYHGAYNQQIICHELAHQWFGDLVTCADFGHIWLNEGFATWSEALWRELSEGPEAYHEEMADARYLGPGTIFVYDPDNVGSIFNYHLSYRKASWVPHMLRHMLGDEDFFTAIRLYLDTHAHGSATTEQFQEVFEDVSGRDLTAFFQQWIYGEYYPIYDFSWTPLPSGTGFQVATRIEQVQFPNQPFSMPLDIRIETDSGMVTHVVENSEAVQWYDFYVDEPVISVALDPDHWVLRVVNDQGITAAPEDVPAVAQLLGIVPNPFNPATEVRFSLPEDQPVRLAVFDISGRLVKTLVDEVRPAGDNTAWWDGTDRANRAVASGAYFVRLTTERDRVVRPLTLVR
jgi:aminopeptidase N